MTIENQQQASPLILKSVSKCYRIFDHPQDRFKQAMLDRLGRLSKREPLYKEYWALKDVSFELKQGEAVGVIGRNGAGKSTLLQIIAGTLEQTGGNIQTNGLITALLELGSGFNPEFTGRENVFLNGQILGLTQEEILNKYDDIVGFADIGEYLDQPVKTYSSGMMMRLAFAVQTAVEPSILIVDEALSVGDMFFQAKCMARISKLVDSGVTLLLVSHDVNTIRQVCQKAIFLDGGEVRQAGSVSEVVDKYVRIQIEDRNFAAQTKVIQEKKTEPSGNIPGEKEDNLIKSELTSSELEIGRNTFLSSAEYNRVGNENATILNIQMLRDNVHSNEFSFNDKVLIRVYVKLNQTLENVNLTVKVRTMQGTDIVYMDTRLQNQLHRTFIKNEVYVFNWTLNLPLMHGNYLLSVGLAHPPIIPGEDWQFIDMIPQAYQFSVAPRSEGMIDGYTTLPASLYIEKTLINSPIE